MKSEIIRFRFKGKKFDNHTIDVKDLAPALLALGDLCTITNELFNKGNAKVNVIIRADVDQNCFELGFELVQSFYDQLRGIVNDGDVATAKQILEWIGIVVVPGTLGYWQALKWMNGRSIKQAVPLENGKVEMHVYGNGNNVNVVTGGTARMLGNNELLNSTKTIMEKAGNDPGNEIEFESNREIVSRFNSDDAAAIMANTQESILYEKIKEDDPQVIKAWITVFSPVYEDTARRWRFWYGENKEYFDISETTIAKDAIKRGGAMVNDAYHVEVQITQKITESGQITNQYKILKVLDFKPAIRHGSLF